MNKNITRFFLTTNEDGSLSIVGDGTASKPTDSSGKQEESEYITKEDAKAIAKVSIWTISRWLKQKDKNGNYLIRWIKLGTAQCSPVRIDKASFKAYLESKTVQPKEEVMES